MQTNIWTKLSFFFLVVETNKSLFEHSLFCVGSWYSLYICKTFLNIENTTFCLWFWKVFKQKLPYLQNLFKYLEYVKRFSNCLSWKTNKQANKKTKTKKHTHTQKTSLILLKHYRHQWRSDWVAWVDNVQGPRS